MKFIIFSENEWFQFWTRFVKHFDECEKITPFVMIAKELEKCFGGVNGINENKQ